MAAVAEINGLGVNIMGCYEYCFDVQMGTSLKWSTLAGMCAPAVVVRARARPARKSILSVRCLAYEGDVYRSVFFLKMRKKKRRLVSKFIFLKFSNE